MNTISPTFVTVATPPRKGVVNAPGALEAAAWTTDNFQNGLFVFTSTAIRLVLLLAVNVSGRPFGELAVTGTINDFPAGMLALEIGSMTGAASSPMPTRIAKASQKNFAENII